MNNTTSTPDLSNLSPEFLAADNHEKLLKISIAFIVLTTVTYFLFNVSRIYCAERNHWETWVLYPISYFFQLLLGILCICKYLSVVGLYIFPLLITSTI